MNLKVVSLFHVVDNDVSEGGWLVSGPYETEGEALDALEDIMARNATTEFEDANGVQPDPSVQTDDPDFYDDSDEYDEYDDDEYDVEDDDEEPSGE